MEEQRTNYVTQLRAAPTEEAAVDLVYDVLDDLLIAGEFEACDDLLAIDYAEFPPTIALGALTITAQFATKLPNRSTLYAKVRARYLAAGEPDTDAILAGLV